MRRLAVILTVTVLMCVLGVSSVQADISWHCAVDVSAAAGSDLQLEIQLYDSSGSIGDSHALLDNIELGAVVEDFETGDMGGLDDSLSTPGTVYVTAGALHPAVGGNYVARVDEDPLFLSTLVFRDFIPADGATLEFDFKFLGDAGGLDELVFSILDPVTLNPLLPGLTPGFGDVLAVTSGGMVNTSDVSLSPVPATGALVLGAIGFGCAGLIRRFRAE